MRYAPAVLLATALFSLTPAQSRADTIPWFYSWSRTPDTIYADGSTTSYVALSPASQAKAPGASIIEATNIFHYGGAKNGPPALFTAGPSTQFTLTLNIYDPGSTTPGSVSFSGELFGYLTPTADHVQSYYPGTTTKSLVVGKHLYTIQLSTYAPSGEDCTTGDVTAIATVTVQSLPEPASALLAGLALPAAGLVWLRRRRGPPAAPDGAA